MNEADKKNGQQNASGNCTADENTIEDPATNELDDEMSALFKAFDDVSASDELKAQTLSRIVSEEFEGSQDQTIQAPDRNANREAEEGERQMAAMRRRVRFRAIRVVAIAACLALALVGGAAYAVPTSTVQLSQGDIAIELGVNRFGLVVSAVSNDEPGRAIVEEGGLLYQSYDDALARVADAMGEPSADGPFKAEVSSNDNAQREQIEGRNQEFAAERNRGFNPGPAPDGGSPNDTPSGWRPEGEGDPAERQPGDAPAERQPESAPGEWQPEGAQAPADVQGSEGQLSEPSRPNERQTGADQPNDTQSGAAPENSDQVQGPMPNGQSPEGAEPNELGPQSAPESTVGLPGVLLPHA